MPTGTRLDPVRAARLFHALSDPTRLRLLQILRRGERCVCDLQVSAEAAQSRVSFHLKVLKEAGLILDRRDGRWVHYRIATEALADVEAALAALTPTGDYAARCAC
jgi:ArsR family transcriptional regulator